MTVRAITESGEVITAGADDVKRMTQIAPDPEILKNLVSKLTYKRGWTFWLEQLDRGQGSEGLTLIIRVSGPDSYNPETTFNVVHYMIVPAASYNERSWRRWLLDQILLVERHEACEWFRLMVNMSMVRTTHRGMILTSCSIGAQKMSQN